MWGFSAASLVERAREAAQDLAEAAQQVSDSVQAEYRRTFVELDCEIYRIRPNVLAMEFPSEDRIERLAARLNAEFGGQMLIYNMSEKKYDAAKFQGEVVDVAFRGLPAPPVELLMELCLSAHRWLASEEGHVLLVHCFQGYSRSAVFLSCLLAFQGLCESPVDALSEVCRSLMVDDARAIVPSQRRYLTYFQQCQQGLAPKNVRVRLLRLQLYGVPKFESEDNVALRPYVEVWNRGELVYSSYRGLAGGEELPPAVAPAEECATFSFPEDCCVAGDVLLRMRHVFRDGSRDSVLRLAFHTGLAPSEGLQLALRELDAACSDPRFPAGSFLDLRLERAPGKGALESEEKARAVFEKAREVSSQLQAAEAARAREAEAAARANKAAAAAASSAAVGERLKACGVDVAAAQAQSLRCEGERVELEKGIEEAGSASVAAVAEEERQKGKRGDCRQAVGLAKAKLKPVRAAQKKAKARRCSLADEEGEEEVEKTTASEAISALKALREEEYDLYQVEEAHQKKKLRIF